MLGRFTAARGLVARAVGVFAIAALAALAGVGAQVVNAGEASGVSEGSTVALPGPPLVLLGMPVATALWLLTGLLAAGAGLYTASRRTRPRGLRVTDHAGAGQPARDAGRATARIEAA